MTLKPMVHDSDTCSFKTVDKIPGSLVELSQGNDLINSISSSINKTKYYTETYINKINQQMVSDPLWVGSYTPYGSSLNSLDTDIVFYRKGDNTSFNNTFVTLVFSKANESENSIKNTTMYYVTIYISDLISNYTNINLKKAIDNVPGYLPHDGRNGESTEWATSSWHGAVHSFYGYVYYSGHDVAVNVMTDEIGSALKVFFDRSLVRLRGIFISYPMGYQNTPNTVIDVAKRLKANSVKNRVLFNNGKSPNKEESEGTDSIAEKKEQGLKKQQDRLNSLYLKLSLIGGFTSTDTIVNWVNTLDLTNDTVYSKVDNGATDYIAKHHTNIIGLGAFDQSNMAEEFKNSLINNYGLNTNTHPEYLFSNIDWSTR